MSEAELLELYAMSKAQLDQSFAQLIALSSALIVAIYYFLHRSGIWLKIAVFVLYAIGWYVLVMSAVSTGGLMQGVVADLAAIQNAGNASAATTSLLNQLRSGANIVYLVAANAANFLLLIGAFIFLFFWKPPADDASDD